MTKIKKYTSSLRTKGIKRINISVSRYFSVYTCIYTYMHTHIYLKIVHYDSKYPKVLVLGYYIKILYYSCKASSRKNKKIAYKKIENVFSQLFN